MKIDRDADTFLAKLLLRFFLPFLLLSGLLFFLVQGVLDHQAVAACKPVIVTICQWVAPYVIGSMLFSALCIVTALAYLTLQSHSRSGNR